MRIATIVPSTKFGELSESENFKEFCTYLEKAKELGADLAVFPESYPDNWKPPVSPRLLNSIKEQVKKSQIHVMASILEPSSKENYFHNTSILFDENGNEIGRYRRTTPKIDDWLYEGGERWQYNWMRGDDLPVFETGFGKVGILVCSEIYAPFLATRLAQKGASIILYPTGLTSKKSPLIETWKTMAWARAIENLCVTVVTSNSVGEGGLSMICSPEEVLLETFEEGVHVVDVDLERVAQLRKTPDTYRTRDAVNPFRVKPGILKDWIRNDLKF